MFTTTLGRITVAAIVIATFCMGIFLVALWSVNDALYYEPALVAGEIDVSFPSAKAVLVFDMETGTEIASKNSNEVLPIASVTKLLTATIFYEEADLNASTTIVWQDLNTEGAAGRLQFYDEYTYRELLYPLLLESSNDAAAAMLRVHPDLLLKMDEYATSLGLTKTKFEDTSGLSDKNVSTAHELSLLARAIYTDQPHIIDITSLIQFIGSHTGWMNNNPLVAQDGYKGGKHGFTYAANRTDVAFFNEKLASGHERTIGYVLLGSENIVTDMEHLRAEVQQKVTMQ